MKPTSPLIILSIGISVLLTACKHKKTPPAPSGGPATPATPSGTPAPAPAPAGPELQVLKHEAFDGEHTWSLGGSQIGELTIRLIYISDGKATVASESTLASDDSNEADQRVQISLRKRPGKREAPASVLGVSFENLVARDSSVNNEVTLPEGLSGEPNLSPMIIEGGISSDGPEDEPLYRGVYLPSGGSGTVGRSIEAMTEASKDGMTVIAITLDWNPN